jgi:hypothetical protein
VWLDNTVLMMEGEAYPHVPDQWWSFGTRPGVSGDGTPFWIGGITDVQGGNATNRGLFLGVGGTPLLIGGAALPHLPDLLSVDNTIGLDYRFSAAASHYICEVEMQGASATNNAIVIDGVGLVLDGSLVREGSTIPVDIGGEGAEAWDNFDFLGIAESGAWFLTGDSDGPASTDEVVVRNGEIILRQGDIVDGALLVGAIEGAYLNENGDLALIWDIRDPAVPANTLEVLLLNDRLLLQVGDEVDFDGDGELDVGAVVADFTGTSSLTLGDRDFAGEVAIWFTADVDTAGTASSTDDIEAFFVLHVDPQPIPVRLSGLSAEADPRTPIVTVQWHTSLEFDHAGFHVYRSDARHGHRERLTDRLVTGSRDYRWVDRKVQPSHSYFYEIGAVDTQGREVRYGPVPAQTPAWGLRTALAPGRPNPFVRRTQIEFTLARESRATLTIHDVAGRRVATLVDGMLPSGDHEVAWDGTTAGGRRGAAGIYFYRLETAGHSETRKLVRLQR